MHLDFLHKTSTGLGKTHAVVFVEDLKIRNMTRSARETSGRNVRQKSGLNRSILSQGWGTFLSLLEYKLSRRGGRLVRVDPRNTSRTCFACGHVAVENRMDQNTFRCVLSADTATMRTRMPRKTFSGREDVKGKSVFHQKSNRKRAFFVSSHF